MIQALAVPTCHSARSPQNILIWVQAEEGAETKNVLLDWRDTFHKVCSPCMNFICALFQTQNQHAVELLEIDVWR
jgi:hypothetical protein